ncbi:winged helix-turn-helix domain-containing protein [Cellulomonas septica]|uniref:Response regulator transcription factor n=1 Tax=Cellulomonas septica TaxID=285080 RepID=A0ABX1JXE2_9CELL|nr:response regulator transcription factor [Cellulomonas septica]
MLTALRQRPPQVVVLSARAPVPDPADLVTRLRLDLHCPVLVALGDGDVARAASAIVAGGTPALSLPLSPIQMLRVLAPVWIDPPRPEVTLRLGTLEMDHARLAARVGGRRLQTSVTEFAVLWRLAQRAGAVVAREDLWSLWPGARDPDGALVAAVTRIRARLHALGVAQSIVTLRGVGYRWDDPADTPHLALTGSGAVITA